MADEDIPNVEKLITLLWGRLMLEKRYSSAASVALLGYRLGEEKQDEELKAGALSLITKAMDELG
jgi:hypothetical protein